MALIGINGYANSGKDAVGIIIQYLNCTNVGNLTIEDVIEDYEAHQWWLEEQSEWEIKKYAGKLKDIASHLTGIPIEDFEDQEFKKQNLGPQWTIHGMPMTVRQFLQRLGTDALRDGLHTNVWVNALFADYLPLEEEENVFNNQSKTIFDDVIKKVTYPNWVITDVRFINEAKAIKDRGGIIIRIDRPGVTAINNHPSETDLDNWKFDYKIVNNSDLISLKFNVKNILEHATLSKKEKVL
jgi:hypothetical protein